MYEQAKKFIHVKPWGPLISWAILAGIFWGAIWAVIEPLDLPDQIPITIIRWVGHLSLSIIFGGVGTMSLLLIARPIMVQTAAPLPFDFSYTIQESSQFYDAIASSYDGRNSSSLLKTHSKIVELIKARLSAGKSVKILDLGGGTGRGVAHHFFDNKDITWNYVEQSVNMFKQFSENTSGITLDTRTYLKSIDTFLSEDHGLDYDIILISLVLTSLVNNPSWKKINSLLSSDGRLIISDIDASYTSLHPFYVVEAKGKKHGFEPRPVPASNLIHEITSEGLEFIRTFPILEGAKNYSFIAEFKRP